MKGLETILERNRAVKEANKLYRQFTADNELRGKYEARQKYLRDVSTIKNVSYTEGQLDGKIENAMAMKQNGESIKKSKRYTGLSAEDIEKL